MNDREELKLSPERKQKYASRVNTDPEFNPGAGKIASKKGMDPNQIKADHVYKTLHEIRAIASNILSLQVQINEKLVNDPTEDRELPPGEQPERAINPRHLPGFTDLGRDILEVLFSVQRRQEFLDTHI